MPRLLVSLLLAALLVIVAAEAKVRTRSHTKSSAASTLEEKRKAYFKEIRQIESSGAGLDADDAAEGSGFSDDDDDEYYFDDYDEDEEETPDRHSPAAKKPETKEVTHSYATAEKKDDFSFDEKQDELYEYDNELYEEDYYDDDDDDDDDYDDDDEEDYDEEDYGDDELILDDADRFLPPDEVELLKEADIIDDLLNEPANRHPVSGGDVTDSQPPMSSYFQPYFFVMLGSAVITFALVLILFFVCQRSRYDRRKKLMPFIIPDVVRPTGMNSFLITSAGAGGAPIVKSYSRVPTSTKEILSNSPTSISNDFALDMKDAKASKPLLP